MVWLLIYNDWCWECGGSEIVVGVFSTKEKAKKECMTLKEDKGMNCVVRGRKLK